jgi:aspartate aminotransferase
MRDGLAQRRDFIVRALSGIEGLSVATPSGAFYAFVSVAKLLGDATEKRFASDVDVAEYLLDEARVATVPGSAFHAPGYLRLSYATSMAQLQEAAARIDGALRALKSAR